MELNEQIVIEVKKWVGVKYQHRSITKFGCDCTGLLIGVMQSLGYAKKYKLRMYPRDWNLHSMANNYVVKEIEKVATKVVGKKQPGDLILFDEGKCTSHIGIMIEGDLFVHSLRKNRKCVIGKLTNSRWSKRVANYYRLNLEKIKRYG